MAKKGLSAAKAKKILTDGYIKGKPLTAKQRKYFGAIANGATPLKKINGSSSVPKAQSGWLDKYQTGGSLPGASGMMYSRTSGSPLIEPGKLKKAQDGDKTQANENNYEFNLGPVYDNLQSFYERNKDVKTTRTSKQSWANNYKPAPSVLDSLPFVNSEEDDGTEANLLTKGYNGNIRFNFCEGEQCAARANRVVNAFSNTGSPYFTPSDETKTEFGMGFSTSYPPTEEQIKENPHFINDTNFGSADSWDYMDAVKKTNPSNVLFSYFDKIEKAEKAGEKIDYKTRNKYYSAKDDWKKYNIPMGSYIFGGLKDFKNPVGGNFGSLNTSEKEGAHTARVIGYLKSGEPLIADYGDIVPYSEFMNSRPITGIVSVPGKEQHTFERFKKLNKNANKKSDSNYWSEKIPEDAGSDYISYHQGIAGSQNYIQSALNISPEEYERYAKIAMTIPAKESDYGRGKVYNYTDWMGESTGPSQLNMKNVSDKYSKTLKQIENKYGKNTPEYEGAATILYIKELDSYTKNWAEKGENSQTRPYKRREWGVKELARETLQGQNPTGYFTNTVQSGISDTFVYDKPIPNSDKTTREKIRLPYKQIWQDEESYTKEVNEMLPQDLSFKFQDGERVIEKDTKGNKIPNTLEDNVFYSWQSPNTLMYGDAQGDSTYYSGLKNAYQEMYGDTPKQKHGGSTPKSKNETSLTGGWLDKYEGEVEKAQVGVNLPFGVRGQGFSNVQVPNINWAEGIPELKGTENRQGVNVSGFNLSKRIKLLDDLDLNLSNPALVYARPTLDNMTVGNQGKVTVPFQPTIGLTYKFQEGGNLPKAQNGIKEAISKYLGDPYGEAKKFAENPDELANIDNMRHAQATRLTQEAIANKTGNIPLISDALGLLGSNALGIGHELTTLFGDKDKRDWSTKLQESGEDVFNNIFGSVVGALPMDNKTKDDVIKYASYNNMLPDGYVRGEQGEEDGLSENVYFKNEDNEIRRPEYKNGGLLPKAQDGNFGGVNTNILDTSGEPIYDIVNPDDSNYDAKYKETYEGGAFASMPNPLDEVVISSGVDYNKDIYYDTLTDQEKDIYHNDQSPIGRGVRRRAQTKRGLAEDALAIPGQLLQGALETAQAPQAAMIEGIEALRGNDYNFSNALPGSGMQRLPSQTFGFEDKPGWDLGGSVNTAMDLVADPSNLVGVGLYDDVVKLGLKAAPKLNSIAKTFGKYSDDLIDKTKNISKFNTAKTTPVDINAPWWETAGYGKPDIEMNNIFSRILDKLPKKVRETYASRVKGITKANDLPRLDSSEFDILKNIDEIMTLREMGGSRQIMLERALKSNLDDPILESIFYKNKKQLQSELDDLTSIDGKPKKVVGTLDSTEEGVEQAIENVNRYGVVQLNPDISGFSLNRPSTSSRPSVDIDTMVRNIYDDVDNVATNNVATKKSQINEAVTEIPNRVRQSKPAPKNSTTDVEDLSGQDLANVSSYPYVKPGGFTEELVSLVKLGPNTSKRDYANMVKDARARVRMSTRGEIFTGSTDTSYQSYLPQLNEVFSSKMKGVADPIFLGYKPMNPMGNINRAAGNSSRSVTRGINENIAAYLNNQIDTNISKIKLPDDLLRPFFQNSSGEVMLPQYGLRKLKKGGVIKDDMGQWAHPGEVTEISGNTMATHGYGDNPLYVVPDVGEPRMVQANTGTQTFPGATKFTEYPMAKNGSSLVELNQLTNFTNYNTPQPGGWLDKYN